jgi:hypothetical protein
VLQSEPLSLSGGGVRHWLKRRNTRENKTCDKKIIIIIMMMIIIIIITISNVSIIIT